MTILETFIRLRDDLKLWVTNNLKTKANISHKHTISDLTDYTIDTELSSTSTNPVQNKVIADAINEAKEDASSKLTEAKEYADSVATTAANAAKSDVLSSVSEYTKVYSQNDEPIDAPEGSLWLDIDATYVENDSVLQSITDELESIVDGDN